MALRPDFVSSLVPATKKEVGAHFINRTMPQLSVVVEIRNELRPDTLFCYLGARFGPPNGPQTFLRNDDSDNLIHWDWCLKAGDLFVFVLGLNFRTEVQIYGKMDWEEGDRDRLIAQFKSEYQEAGPSMKKVRSILEHWSEFVNPYARLKQAIDHLKGELEALDLDIDRDRASFSAVVAGQGIREHSWYDTGVKYSKAFGICFAMRAMIPMMAEAFINLVMFATLRPEIKTDPRLKENAFRQPLDVRIKSLGVNCVGFKQKPDFAHPACKAFHTLVNERNDLLHGNVNVTKLQFNEVYFLGKIPVFREYRDMWERSLEVSIRSSGFLDWQNELEVAAEFIDYIKTCLLDEHVASLSYLANSLELGWNHEDGRLGVLFPDHLVDMWPSVRDKSTSVIIDRGAT